MGAGDRLRAVLGRLRDRPAGGGEDRQQDGRSESQQVRGGRRQPVSSVLQKRTLDRLNDIDALSATASRDGYSLLRLVNTGHLVVHGVMGATIVSLVGVVIGLVGFYEPKPVFVRVSDRADQVLWFEAGDVAGDVRSVVTEKLLGQYVVARETIDLQSEGSRWELVEWLSTEKLFTEFMASMSKDNKRSPFQAFKAEGRTRAVTVGRVVRLGSTNVWEVEFSTTDRRSNEIVGTARWVATMTISENDERRRFGDRFMNPWGLRVESYGIGEHRFQN